MISCLLNSRTLKIFGLFILIISRPALGDGNRNSLLRGAAHRGLRELAEELDPSDANDCFSMGELDVMFRTDNNGPPQVGVVLTDPRGRRIGFDPIAKHGWQELPVAQG